MNEPLRVVYEEDRVSGLKMGLYVTDREIIRRLGFGKTRGYQILHELAVERPGRRHYPPKDRLFCGRRFWPAVLQWHMDYHAVRAAGSAEATIGSYDQPKIAQGQNPNESEKSRLEELVNIYSSKTNGKHPPEGDGERDKDAKDGADRFANRH